MKSLIKLALVALLVIIFQTAAINVYAETAVDAPEHQAGWFVAPEPTAVPEEATPAPLAEATEESSVNEEPTETPQETIAPDASLAPTDEELIMSLLDPDRSVKIVASWDAERLGVGDVITLLAVAEGYEKLGYDFTWQASADGVNWIDQAASRDASLTYILDESNYAWSWRVVIVIYGPAQE